MTTLKELGSLVNDNHKMNVFFSQKSESDCQRIQKTLIDIMEDKYNCLSKEEKESAAKIARDFTAKWICYRLYGQIINYS